MIHYAVASTATAVNASPIPEWIKLILQFIWVPIIVPIFVFLVKKITKNILTVKEITNATDQCIAGFIDLYKKRIKQDLRIDAETILAFIDKKNNDNVSHHLYICKHAGKVVGFVKFMVSHPKKSIFVAYIAIDQNDEIANKRGVNELLKKLVHKFFKPRCPNNIIVEIEQGKGGNYNTSLARTIRRYASAYNHDAYYIDAPYIQPKMPGENASITSEDFLSLIFIPYYKPENAVISKNDYIKIIEFIYFDVYGPSCNDVVCDCRAYNDYLSNLISMYKSDHNDYINLVKIGVN